MTQSKTRQVCGSRLDLFSPRTAAELERYLRRLHERLSHAPIVADKPLSKCIADETVNGLQWLYLRRSENRDAISSVAL